MVKLKINGKSCARAILVIYEGVEISKDNGTALTAFEKNKSKTAIFMVYKNGDALKNQWEFWKKMIILKGYFFAQVFVWKKLWINTKERNEISSYSPSPPPISHGIYDCRRMV